MEQVRLLSEKTVNEKDVMKAVEKTGALSTEIAKVRVKKLLLVKKVLTPEQVEKVEEMRQNATRARHERMREMSDEQREQMKQRWQEQGQRREKEGRGGREGKGDRERDAQRREGDQ